MGYFTFIYIQAGCVLLPSQNKLNVCDGLLDSFPGPNQVFVTCSTEKWGEPGWYLFSHEHDVIRTSRLRFVYCSTEYMLNAWCVCQLLPAS